VRSRDKFCIFYFTSRLIGNYKELGKIELKIPILIFPIFLVLGATMGDQNLADFLRPREKRKLGIDSIENHIDFHAIYTTRSDRPRRDSALAD
jgi:hypothetical protein